MSRYDLVIYGVTGYTGTKVLEVLLRRKEKLDFAVAGRNEGRIRNVLDAVGKKAGSDLSKVPIIIADSNDEYSLASMAKQAKVIVNTVGPYRLYGEPVVKAAVENGASHVDVSGEPAFLDKMQLKYSEAAEKNGVYIVGSCGWDSIPCDLGVNFLKDNFGGQLNHVETFLHPKIGPAGYAVNTGTYQSLVLGMSNMFKDGLGEMRRTLMPEKLPRSGYGLPKRRKIWYHDEINAYCLPFPGSDKSVAGRSQYFNYKLYQEYPVLVETYFNVKSLLWTLILVAWLSIFVILTQFEFTKKFLQNHPELCSFGAFRESGPTEEQIQQSSFIYWFYGSGWAEKFSVDEVPSTAPNKKVTVRCDGPDPGYISTSGCVLSAALTVLYESEKMPKSGGVYPPGTAFKKTNIYGRLKDFGITFKVVDCKNS